MTIEQKERRMLTRMVSGGAEQRGPTAIDLPKTGYIVDMYQKGSYIAEKDELARITKRLIVSSGLWTQDVANQMVESGLGSSDPDNTSWLGFRKSNAPRGEYDGVAWQEELYIPTVRGYVRLLHMKLRAFVPDAQGLHLGRTGMQLALGAHPEVTHISHRTGSAAAARSWLESGVFREGRRFPYDLPFVQAPQLPQILLWLYELYHVNGERPNLSTGVSVGDYIEQNKAYIPDRTHQPTMEILKWMEEKPTVLVDGMEVKRKVLVDGMEKDPLGMDLQRGDSLTEIGELR